MPLHAQPDFHTSSDNHENPLPIPPQLSSQSQPSKITQQSNDLIKQVTNTVQQFTSKSPFYNRPISEPNGEIPIRQISSPPQITPPHQLLDDSTGAPCFGLKKSGQLNSGENGVPAVQILQNQRQKRPSHRNNSFPKISTNFDAPSSSTHQLNSTLQRKSTAPPARQNVPMIPHNAVPSEPSKNNAPPPHAVKPTFASTLKSIQEQSCLRLDISPAKQTTKQGYPAVIFKREDYMVKLAERCKFTLIGKFDSTMPRMEVIRRSFEAQVQLKSNVKITHFNSNHVYIDLDNQLDHDTVWFKKTIWIQGRPMNLFTWTPTFKPSQETPIAPIWVVLPELPWHLYYMEAISELFKSVGRAISLDVATFQKTRGSVAKVKLEIDVTKIRPNYFWVGYDDDENGEGYWQEAQYEDVPSYCSYCKHQGHFVDFCAKKRRDDEMGKKNVEEFPISVDATRRTLQNQSREVNKQHPVTNSAQHTNTLEVNATHAGMTIAGKPRAYKKHFIPKNPVNPISNGINSTVMATVNAMLHPVAEENTGGCSGSKTNDITEVVKKKDISSTIPEDHVTAVITQKHDAGVNMKSLMVSDVPKNHNANLNFARVSTNNAFALLSADQEQQVHVSAVTTIATGDNVHQSRKDSRKVGTSHVPGQVVPMNAVKDFCADTKSHPKSVEQKKAAVVDMEQLNANTGEVIFDGFAEIDTGLMGNPVVDTVNLGRENKSVDLCGENSVLATTATVEIIKQLPELQGTISHQPVAPAEPTDALQLTATLIANGKKRVNHGIVQTNSGFPHAALPICDPFGNHFVDQQLMDGLNSAAPNQNAQSSATFKSGEECPKAITEACSPGQSGNQNSNEVTDQIATCTETAAKETTKTWIERSFGKVIAPDSAAVKQLRSVPTIAEVVPDGMPVAQTCATNASKSAPVSGKKISQLMEKNTSTTGGKNKKKSGKKAGKSVQQTEEEILKAEKMAFWDAILAKSYAENPVIESNIEPLNVRENKATVSIPSQHNFDPANILPLGSDDDEIESNKALTAYVSPAHSGNTLIPTATLEVMCKQASKVMKEVGRGFFPVTPQARIDTEAHEAPTYYLGDLFEDSQNDQNEPSKDVKSKWNLDAPLFIPNALRQQEPHIPIESVDSQDGSDFEFPAGPSDEVLLQSLNLHDIRGLLHRQNSPPQELPQKFLSPHPGIIEDGSEYEEEDEDSTAYNDMAEARYAGLSPRVEQAVKPKLIKKKRRPLEIPKKREAAPKKAKRVQPTRSSKSRSSRRK